MKLSIEQKKLLSLLNHCQIIVERKSTVVATDHILLQGQAGQLKIEATDLDLSLQEFVEAEVESEGIAIVPAGPMIDIVKKLPDEIIQLQKKENILLINTKNIHFELQLAEEGAFPTVEKTTYPYTWDMNGKELRQMLEKVQHHISSDESRYTMYGVYIHPIEGGHLRFVATDGHRLAYAETTVYLPEDFKKGIILPKKTIRELLAILEDDRVTVQVSERKISFSFGSLQLTSKLVSGEFVNYEQIIPKDNPFVIHMDAGQLSKATDRVTSISTDRLRGVILEFQAKKIKLSSSSEKYGKGAEEITCDYEESEHIRLGFNSRYIMDLCAQIGQGSLEFVIKDSLSAVIAKDTGDEHTLFIIMPMRI